MTENFVKVFGKVVLATIFATALLAGSFLLTTSVTDACAPQCSDFIDNDGDDLVDAADPGCWTDTSDPESYDPYDDSESYDAPAVYECSDDADNDGDGLADWRDPDCHTDGDASNDNSYDPNDDDESGPAPEIFGSINICKIIIDEEENIVNGDENYGKFTIEGIEITGHPTVAYSAGVLDDAVFETALTYGADLIGGDQVNDAVCVSYGNLTLGGYFYGEENIVGEYWQTPLYNDQVDGPITLNDLYQYSGELFTDDGGADDEERDTKADGHIVLSENRPDRTLVVLNAYEIPPITIVATKIVCEDESYLPNWGATQTPIDENTAANFLNDNEHCSIAQDWQFQWAPKGTGNPGDNTGVSVDWTTFTESTEIELSELPEEANDYIWVREVWNDLYTPFTGANTTEDESAEMYCHIDTINYDNYDRVDGIQAGEIYYCVGFNAEIPAENTQPIITVDPATITITTGDNFDPTDHATADDAEDGDITGDIVVSGDTVDTNTVGTYYVVYDVDDFEGLAAETKTLEVIVEERTPNLCRVDLDVMIVMDRSGSMGWDDPTRLSQAKEAANSFVGKLGSDDQSGLVSFATYATTDKGLSNDHPATQTAINGLSASGATNIGDGIGLANDEFSTSSQALKIEILLTDGRANKPNGDGRNENPDDVAYAEQKAWEAANEGIKIFTIGLGSDINETMLQNIATTTGGAYYYAPSSEDLDEIFDEIAWDVCQYGSISGCKYEAVDYEDTSGGDILSDWEIVLGGDADLTQFTNGDGCYIFTGLVAGEYTVSEAVEQGVDFVQTHPQCPTFYSVTLADEEEAAGYDFVNYLPTCGNSVLDENYGEECDDGNTENGDGCSNQCLFEEEEPICSISGYKYNYDTGLGLVNWLIGLAQIVECATGEEWADSVVSYSPVGTIADERDDPEQALGVTDYDETSGTYNFVSLGMGGELILEFDNLILNGDGDDIEVVETSWGNPTCAQYPEKVKAYASQDGDSWEYLGKECLNSTFDLGNLSWAKYVKLVDESDQQGDGYDVDAVRAIHCRNYTTVGTTTTDVSGAYCFADLEDGSYAVYEEMQSGWSIMSVMIDGISSIFHVDSFFDVFVEVEIEDGGTTTVDFYNQEDDVPEENEPPVADAGSDQTVTVDTEVNFDGSNSTDPDGTIVSYDWDFVDGDTGTGATTTHIYTAIGTYSVVLTVTDDDGDTGDDMVEITVVPADIPPICENVIVVSNTDDMIVGGGNAVETYDGHTAWTAVIDTAAWIWEYYYVQNPAASETVNFTKDFEILGIPATTTLMVAADNTYTVWVNGTEVAVVTEENNFQLATQDEHDVSGMLQAGTNTISFEVMNIGSEGSSPESNPAGLLYRLEIEIEGDSCLNTPPTILGADDPLVFYIGDIETEAELEALARLGVTATDAEDGDITGDIVITNLGSVSTSTIGTTTISYDVVDSWSYPAETVEREVRTTTQCSDGIDNDDDTMVDEADPGCWTDTSDPESYDPNDNDESYDAPVVYECSDDEDNDDDDLTDEEDPGCWTDPTDSSTYDPTDDDEYNAPAPCCGDGICNGSETCATCSQDCGACSTGGGGGGGWIPMTIIINHEDVEYLGDGNAIVTWDTNIPATSQVVYGDDSINRGDLGDASEYGYDSVNVESLSMRTNHSMLVTGLTHGTQYYFRPVSDKSGIAEVVGKEVTYTFTQDTPAVIIPVCTYLLEYIKLGSANNPVEVEKLERFLNDFEGEDLTVNGIYEQADYEAVKRFQIKYREDILDPWNHDEATGYVYLTTKKKINELYCQSEFPLTVGQEAEIAAFSTLLSGLQDTSTGYLEEVEAIDIGSVVGAVDSDSGDVLADASSDAETGDEAEGPGLLANILGALGFGDDEEAGEDGTDVLADDAGGEEDSRNMAAVVFNGILDLATSFWFILLLIVIAIILFFRIRGAEGEE